MPNRILKESICTSENIDKLSPFDETVFYRLIVNCDDYGRLDARPKILVSKLFPLKDIRANQIESALQALASAELVSTYVVDGKPFLQMSSWEKHQQIRSSKSKYPGPDGSYGRRVSKSEDCNQMLSDVSECKASDNIEQTSDTESDASDIESETSDIECSRNRNRNRDRNRDRERDRNTRTRVCESTDDTDFDLFWKAYPRHIAKQKAQTSFRKISPKPDIQVLLAAIERQKKSAQWRENERYIPHPTTWLNQRRWEDESVSIKNDGMSEEDVLPGMVEFSAEDRDKYGDSIRCV